MILKQIFIVKFILIIKYLPAIVESHLPPRSSPNIFYIIFIGRRVIVGRRFLVTRFAALCDRSDLLPRSVLLSWWCAPEIPD